MTVENYSLQPPDSFLDRLALKKRLEMLDLFLEEFPQELTSSILDVGVTADQAAQSSNFLEKYYSEKEKITALSNQDALFLEELYPGIKFKHGDAKNLPFENDSIDVVFSSAVIEHIGNIDNQKQLIAECVRVAKYGVFITTPNRWFPLEVHTVIPFIHWLPKGIHRSILKLIGYTFHAQEDNLNLLDVDTLLRLCKQLKIKYFYIKGIKTWGFYSNLILIIKK